MMGRSKILSIYVVSLTLFALPVFAQTATQSDTTPNKSEGKASALFEIGGANDPFVRGLKRLDTSDVARQKMEQELAKARKEMKRMKYGGKAGDDELDADISDGFIAGDPAFGNAFSLPRYRLDGILVSEAPLLPIIHVSDDELRRSGQTLFWSADDKRWAYRLSAAENYKTVARKFSLHPQDVLAMNRARNPDQLAGREILFISPRDNGPLIHTVRKGESLSLLAQTYDVPLSIIKKRNSLAREDLLIIGQRLHIRDKTISQAQAELAVPAPNELDKNAALMARRVYVRLARYPNLSKAMRGAREFYDDNRRFIDSDIILRLERDAMGQEGYNLDLGPMVSSAHGKNYCKLFTRRGLACETVRRVPGEERLNTFESTAIVRVSPTVFYNGDVDEDIIEIGKTKDIEYQLKEGQTLGVDEGVVVKITHDQILVADKEEELLALNLNYLPEVDQEVLQARREAERQAQLDAAAKAASALADNAELPEIEVPNIAKRLAENEQKRRKGSTGQTP
ncbi:MAG: LysM peptidoglycan-binding domain-containing protein [Parvibaculales bacterium]